MQFTPIKIDYTNAQHGQDLITVLNNYAKDEMGGGEAIPDDVLNSLPSKLASIDGAFSFIIYSENTPAALVNCLTGFSTFKGKPIVNIHDLAVEKAFRGHGLSQTLLSLVEQEARKLGCCKVTLEVLSGNDVAKNAYQKYGFSGYELDPKAGHALFWELPLK